MRKKTALFILALLLTAAANLRPCCELSVDGNRLSGLYSISCADAGERAAAAAAEEICPREAAVPELERRYRLRLSPPGGEAGTVSDALLRAAPGVSAACAVYVDGTRLGCAESGAVLAERLHGMLYEALPAGVASARLDCTLALEPLYTRTEFVSPYGEMLSRITGAAPVIYTLDWRQML